MLPKVLNKINEEYD